MTSNTVPPLDSDNCQHCGETKVRGNYLFSDETKRGHTDATKECEVVFNTKTQLDDIMKKTRKESWTWLEVNCESCGNYWPNNLILAAIGDIRKR